MTCELSAGTEVASVEVTIDTVSETAVDYSFEVVQ